MSARLALLAALLGRAALAEPTARAQDSSPDDDLLVPLVPPKKDAGPPPALSLQPSVGFGWSAEDGFDGEAVHARIGATFAYRFTETLSAEAAVRDLFYRREYLSDRFDSSGGLARLRLDEQKVDVEAFFTVDVARLLSLSPAWRLPLGAGPGFRFFVNEALPSTLGGPAGRAEVGYALSPAIDVSAGATALYNVVFDPQGVASALGGPAAAVGWRGAIGLGFPENLRFHIAYEGERVTLVHSQRLYHSIAFLLDLPL